MNPDLDEQIRLAAFAALGVLAAQNGGVVTSEQLDRGFEFQGERIRFWNKAKGIWRPRQLGNGAALSVYTAAPRPGRAPRYDDRGLSDRFVYRYEGTDPNLWTNVAVRRAMELGRPIIYLIGVTPGLYLPVFPCSVVGDDPASLSFELMADAVGLRPIAPMDEAAIGVQRRWATVEVKRRLHQQRFRELVVAAYHVTCAMCRLKHNSLLDAAHIIPDREEHGLAEVPNGLCLCKIHHTAFDVNIVGVDADYRIHVREDVLEEHDGPMLKHGLQEMAGLKLHVPKAARLKPAKEYLEERFGRFKAA